MKVFVIATILAGATLFGPAYAQDSTVVRETRCWLGSVTFSSGALMNTGRGVMACVADRGWLAAEEEAAEAAGCLLEGDLSSVGAVVGISNNDSMSLQCAAGGRWETIPVAVAPAD